MDGLAGKTLPAAITSQLASGTVAIKGFPKVRRKAQ